MTSASPITVRVPATIANMGPGFDSFGMAVSLYNEFTFTLTDNDALILPPDELRPDLLAMAKQVEGKATDQLLWQAFERVYQACGQTRPAVSISMTCDVPLSRGLGSSSTAIIAALMAANRFSGDTLNQQALLDLAIELEHHPDNVAPALLGGVVLYDTKPYSLPWPTHWQILALSPAYPVSTQQARGLLPESLGMADAVFNLRKASVLTYALLQEDPDALRCALDDRLHQPARSQLIPEFDAFKACALDNGAFGFIISGSGPTMACFYPADLKEDLTKALTKTITQLRKPIELHALNVDNCGSQIL